MLSIADKNNLYSKVTNKKYSTTREYLSSTYGEPKVRYYNADTKEEKKEKKRLETRYLALIIAAFSALLGIVSLITAKHKNSGISKVTNKAMNVMCNFNNAKDDYWNKALRKMSEFEIFNCHPLSFLEKIAGKITNFYKKTVMSSFSGEWDKNAKSVMEMAKNEGIDINIEKFENWYNGLSETIFNRLHEKNNRITDNLVNKNIFKRFTSGIIANDKIQGISQIASEKISLPQNASRELVEQINKFNEYKTKTASVIVPKLRDVNLGSGPTDVLNQSFTLLALLTAIKASKTKEEKQSITINFGIPLVTALATTTIATLKALSGTTALAFGLITGECASIGANLLSKSVSKHKQKERI